MTSTAPIKRSGYSYAQYVQIGQYEASLWEGRSAEELQITGLEMTPANCDSLAQGRHPETGKLLKPRHKQTINIHDLTIGAPKSVSLLAIEDDRVRRAFLDSIARTMRGVELATPNQSMVYVRVPHYSSRNSDPHLHVHNGIINLTFNSEKQRWECLQPNFLYWPRHQITESHRLDLAGSLNTLGYGILDKPKQGFEIEGVSKELMQRFSSRSQEIAREDLGSQRLSAISTRGEKKEEPATYREYLEFQRDKLTYSERINLRETVEKAYERSYKLRLNIEIAEGEEAGPNLRPATYGQRITM